METIKAVKLIQAYEARDVRKDFATRHHSVRSGPDGLGGIDEVIGTGRATCRSCNTRIEKGVPALKFIKDFTGSGSWTAVEIQIHKDDCVSVWPL